MLELYTDKLCSRTLRSIPGVEVSPIASAATDHSQLASMPSLPKWRIYDLLAAAVTAADE